MLAIAFSIIGMNYLAQVDYNVVEFVKDVLAFIEPTDAKYGLGFPPLAEGGWFLITGFFLTASVLFGGLECIDGRCNEWNACRIFAAAIWLFLVLRL